MIDGSLAFDIAASGMSAERTNIDLIAQNLANAGAARAAGAAPYQARYAVFEPATPFSDTLSSAFDDFAIDVDDGTDLAPTGVRLASIGEAPQTRVDSISQMVNLIAAGRAYDADVAVLQGAKQMDMEANDILR